MNIIYLEEVESFQQKVAKVSFGGGTGYSKHIVTNYSWWLFDECDMFENEIATYALLPHLGIGPDLLFYDRAERHLITEAMVSERPSPAQIRRFIDNLVPFLTQLHRLDSSGLPRHSIEDLARNFEAKGRAADVNPAMLDGLNRILERWHERYGAHLGYTHGDLHFGNLITDGIHVTGLIDFEEALASAPIFDAQFIGWDLMEYGPEVLTYFKRAYQEAFDYPIIDMAEWQVFHRVRCWIVSCYLKNCCALGLQDKSKAYFVEKEPLF